MSGDEKRSFVAEDVIRQYLDAELNSGDSKRVKAAERAEKNNREFGIGRWAQDGYRLIKWPTKES